MVPRDYRAHSPTVTASVNVELEFAAMSVAIGASAAGARIYTANASQGCGICAAECPCGAIDMVPERI
jgi:pyruvate/2-oxoacid:ferredoxin oxidoreductase alpha subunit